MARVTVQVQGLDETLARIGKIDDKMKTAVERTVSDAKTRVPPPIAKHVASQYNVSASEVKPHAQGGGKFKRSAGSVSIRGTTIETLALVYEGHRLSPARFRMRPSSRPAGKRAYAISFEVRKGHRSTLPASGAGFFLAANTAGGTHIPFQRRGKSRTPIDAVKTISMPQMVGGKDGPKPEVQTIVNETIRKRFDNHIKQAQKLI